MTAPTEPSTRATRDLLSAAGRFWPLFAVGAVGFTLAALVAGVSITQIERHVVALSTEGTLTLRGSEQVPEGSTLRLYASDPAGKPVERATQPCTVHTSGPSTVRPARPYGPGSGPGQVDGKLLHPLADLSAGWDHGDTVTCPGAAYLAALRAESVFARTAMTGLLSCLAVGSAALALLGRRAAAVRRTSAAAESAPARPQQGS